MQIAVFTIPVNDDGSAEEACNSLLRSSKVCFFLPAVHESGVLSDELPDGLAQEKRTSQHNRPTPSATLRQAQGSFEVIT